MKITVPFNMILTLCQWSNDWMLNFHPEKCSVMHLGRTNPKNKYFLLGAELQQTNTEKDLGVIVDDKLKFEEHIQSKVSKGRQTWGLIRRSFTAIDTATFPLLFKSLVHPHLEYANSVWFPTLKGQSIDIEYVQRSATKQVPGLRDLPYKERLQLLNLPTLKHRRRRGDLIEAYKMMRGIYDQSTVPSFDSHPSTNTTRGHSFKIRRPVSNTNLGHNRFTSRIVNDWNSLPEEIINSGSVNAFKKTA